MPVNPKASKKARPIRTRLIELTSPVLGKVEDPETPVTRLASGVTVTCDVELADLIKVSSLFSSRLMRGL